jgi:hypothetical protein
MNKKLLQKVIDELVKDKPDLSYIRGIVETMIESLPEEKHWTDKVLDLEKGELVTKDPKEEAQILDAQARLAIEKMKEFNKLNPPQV